MLQYIKGEILGRRVLASVLFCGRPRVRKLGAFFQSHFVLNQTKWQLIKGLRFN